MEYFDSHAHLDFADFDADRPQVLGNAIAAGVTKIFVPGYCPEQWARLLELSHSDWGKPSPSSALSSLKIRVGIGLHPYLSEGAVQPGPDGLLGLGKAIEHWAADESVVALGEMGLDKHKGAPLPRQIELLEFQLALARTLELPVVLHQVGVQRELFEALERAGPLPRGGVLHGFGGDVAWAKALIKRGLYIGVGAGILHKPRERLRKAVAQLPLERLVVETDAPDGRLSGSAGSNAMRSQPADIGLVVTRLSELLGASEDLVARRTYENASFLYSF